MGDKVDLICIDCKHSVGEKNIFPPPTKCRKNQAKTTIFRDRTGSECNPDKNRASSATGIRALPHGLNQARRRIEAGAKVDVCPPAPVELRDAVIGAPTNTSPATPAATCSSRLITKTAVAPPATILPR